VIFVVVVGRNSIQFANCHSWARENCSGRMDAVAF